MKSKLADMKNAGDAGGGAITAALFLSRFVDMAVVEWAHLDIAGPVWDSKAGKATGFGVGTVTEWVLAHSSSVHAAKTKGIDT